MILEEIAMEDDEPGDEVHDLFAAAVFGDHALGRRISGTVETISAMTRDAGAVVLPPPVHAPVHRGRRRRQPGPRQGRRGWSRAFAPPRLRRRRRRTRRAPAGDAGVAGRDGRSWCSRKDTEQAHMVLGGAGHGRPRRAAVRLGVLNNVLGGGMSSRLFQEIREKRGLAYSVYSFSSRYADAGLFGSTPAARRARWTRCWRWSATSWPKVAADGVSDREIARGKGMLKGALCSGWRTPARA